MNLRRTFSWRAPQLSLAALLLVPAIAQAAEAACAALASLRIPPAKIGLPSGEAVIGSADTVAAVAQITRADGTVTPAMPEFCKVIGTIASIDPSAPAITFQLNLPTAWNGKALQFGGGGFNGTLVTGLGPAADAPPSSPTPLAQGYLTFGTDSGHQASSLPEPQAFALNEEALENFAYGAYKKVRDVVVEVATLRYGRKPDRLYYMGISEGGREGLTMAQRFPADYDGIISRVPVINWTALQHAGHRSGLMQQRGGWLNPSKVELVSRAVLKACDALDGLSDGIVSNDIACRSAFKVESVRCPTGTDEGDTCLSERQIAAVNAVHAPFQFDFDLTNGVREYPGFGYGGEAQVGGFAQWVMGARAAVFPASPGVDAVGQQWLFGNAVVRYFVLRDGRADPFSYSPDTHADRVRQISALMDSTNPDLFAFAHRGGKIIIKEHMADYAQSPFAGIAYYQSVVAKMSQAVVDQFMCLFVSPGVTHGGAGVSSTTGEPIPQYDDLLGALDGWVQRGVPPGDLVQTSISATPPFTVTASKPMCRWPAYPRYRGGDPKDATSFVCSNQ
ncbi:MAG: tannase/feruloyl esterase family alpha/beta hydrolase [Vicinamibacterales bacterium]